MTAKAPAAASTAAKNRHESADAGFDQGYHGVINTAVYADEAHRSAIDPITSYRSLDTIEDQQLATDPVADLPSIPQSTAPGSVGPVA